MTAPAGAGRARSSGLTAGAGGVLGTARRETVAALRLLTRFPLPSGDAAADGAAGASGAIAFPLIGAFVGLIGAVPLVLLGWLQPLSSLLALAVIAVESNLSRKPGRRLPIMLQRSWNAAKLG